MFLRLVKHPSNCRSSASPISLRGHGWNRSLLQRRCDGGCDVVSCGKPNAINHTQYGFINACESPNGFHGMVYHWVNTHTFEWKSHLFLPYMAGMIFFSPWADHSPRESMCLSCLIPGTRIGCIWNWGIPSIIAIYEGKWWLSMVFRGTLFSDQPNCGSKTSTVFGFPAIRCQARWIR